MEEATLLHQKQHALLRMRQYKAEVDAACARYAAREKEGRAQTHAIAAVQRAWAQV
jgi:hypothetical protein